MSKKIIAVAVAAILIAGCSEQQAAEPAAGPEAAPIAATLTDEDRATIDALGGDFERLSRIIRSASSPTAQRQYAATKFEEALATATAEDLETLQSIVDFIPPSPTKDATRARIESLGTS